MTLLTRRQEEIEQQLLAELEIQAKSWLRLLTVVAQLLQHTRQSIQQSRHYAAIQQLLHSTILPAFSMQHTHPMIRDTAVKCLGLYGLLDREVAHNHLELIIKVMENDVAEVRITATKVLFDWLLMFENMLTTQSSSSSSSSAPSASSSVSISNQEVISKLLILLREEVEHASEMRSVLIEGISKLLLFDRLNSNAPHNHSLLTALFHNFFHPTTDDDTHLRQCLSVFFPLFVSSSARHRQALIEAFYSTLSAVFRATKSSWLSHINTHQMAQYFIHLLSPFSSSHSLSDATSAATMSSKIVEKVDQIEVEVRIEMAPMIHLGFESLCQMLARGSSISFAEAKALSQVFKSACEYAMALLASLSSSSSSLSPSPSPSPSPHSSFSATSLCHSTIAVVQAFKELTTEAIQVMEDRTTVKLLQKLETQLSAAGSTNQECIQRLKAISAVSDQTTEAMMIEMIKNVSARVDTIKATVPMPVEAKGVKM